MRAGLLVRAGPPLHMAVSRLAAWVSPARVSLRTFTSWPSPARERQARPAATDCPKASQRGQGLLVGNKDCDASDGPFGIASLPSEPYRRACLRPARGKRQGFPVSRYVKLPSPIFPPTCQ